LFVATVEAQPKQLVTCVLRTNPPRLGSKFVVRVSADGHDKVSWGGVLDLRNGQYLATYRHLEVPEGVGVTVTVALVEGGECGARRGFIVSTVHARPVVAKFYAYGQGLCAPASGPNTFIVQARSQCHARMTTGGLTLQGFIVRTKGGPAEPLTVRDNQDGTYIVHYECGDQGQFSLDVVCQGQSIEGFPFAVDMDFLARFSSLHALRKIEEDIAYYSLRLSSIDSSSNAKSKMRTVMNRVCVECQQRPVQAILLPCRHYRYCGECATGAYVLGSDCNVCGMVTEGYVVVKEI
jgi:hypothetical protein